MSAVKTWQSAHKRGQAHPQGSCCVAVSSALLNFVSDSQGNALSDDGDALLAVKSAVQLPPAELCHLFAHASARKTAKGTHILLDVTCNRHFSCTFHRLRMPCAALVVSSLLPSLLGPRCARLGLELLPCCLPCPFSQLCAGCGSQGFVLSTPGRLFSTVHTMPALLRILQ